MTSQKSISHAASRRACGAAGRDSGADVAGRAGSAEAVRRDRRSRRVADMAGTPLGVVLRRIAGHDVRLLERERRTYQPGRPAAGARSALVRAAARRISRSRFTEGRWSVLTQRIYRAGEVALGPHGEFCQTPTPIFRA